MIGIWGKIRKKAEELKIIGNELVLECQNHKRKTIISKISDFDNCPEGGCQEPCKKRMACGHVCEKLCHVYNCNEQKCFKPCTRKYSPCGHPCNKLCSEKCDKCEKIVEKKLPCGHIKKKCKCSDDKYFIQCYEKCERKLKCGHSCKLKCYEICESISCKEKVEKILSCGHKNLVECGKQLYELICEEKCQINLECGHDCKGTCGRCLEGTLHVKCESKCDRVLPCGHPCNQKCSAECICEKKCENICLHGYCDDKCCEICVDCKEKCKIGCKHEKCKKKCGELCTRKPCDKRCEKKMECGHQCYGLCGERCPNVCRICNPKMQCFIEDFFYLTELNEDELLYKTNCGHIFSVEGMDYYIKNNRKIQMYSCPVCMKSLILEPRYQNYIKNMFIDIQKVKKISLERNFGKDGETFFSKSKKLVNRILKQYGEEEVETDKQKSKIKREKENIFIRQKRQKIDIFEAYPTKINYQNNDLQIKIPTIYNLCKNEFNNKKNVNLKKNTTYNLLTLAEKFMGIEYYVYVIKSKNNEEEESQFLINYNIIKEYFSKIDGQLTHIFFKSLKKKIDNMLYYTILKLKSKTIYYYFSNLNNDEEEEKEKAIIEEIEKSNFSSEINLKDLYQNQQIELEEINLIRTLGTTWYKCPKGHPYTVGECGRPMEESVCPECNSKIGGLNHNPANQNTEINLNNINSNNHHNNAIKNTLLNQDEEAYNNMNINKEHEMDPEVEEAIRNNPEMSEYN